MATSTAERQKGGIATALVEQQMRFREVLSRAAAARTAASALPRTFGPYVTVSREAGSGGGAIARRVGERLGWTVLDRELVDGLADRLKLEPRVLELMDETRANWFSETLLNLFNTRLVLQHSYVDLIGKAVALTTASEPTVIVGRGAHLILPSEHGIRVRVVAPRALREAAIADSEGLTPAAAAARRMDELDDHRQSFIRRNFKQDAADPYLYDLMINTGRLGIDGAVELILRSLELRGLLSSPPSAD
jgi:cytidylate kinase